MIEVVAYIFMLPILTLIICFGFAILALPIVAIMDGINGIKNSSRNRA